MKCDGQPDSLILDEEAEVQEDKLTRPRSHREHVVELRTKPRRPIVL